MPYKKKAAKRTSGWQDAKTVGKLAYKHRGTAAKALALATKVARMVNVEYKAYETNTVDNIDQGGEVYSLTNGLAQGDTGETRDGISIKPMRLSGRAYIEMNVAAPTTLFRCIIIRGKNEHGEIYTPQGTGQLDILDPDALGPLARKNRDNRFDTNILYDKLFTLSQSGTRAKVLDLNIRLTGHVNYEGGTTNVDNGGLYLLLISDQTELLPVWRSQLTLTYTDN